MSFANLVFGKEYRRSLLHQSFQQLDLSGVINIVAGNSGNDKYVCEFTACRFSTKIGWFDMSNRLTHRAMHFVKQTNVLAPGTLPQNNWTFNPITSFNGK